MLTQPTGTTALLHIERIIQLASYRIHYANVVSNKEKTRIIIKAVGALHYACLCVCACLGNKILISM